MLALTGDSNEPGIVQGRQSSYSYPFDRGNNHQQSLLVGGLNGDELEFP